MNIEQWSDVERSRFVWSLGDYKKAKLQIRVAEESKNHAKAVVDLAMRDKGLGKCLVNEFSISVLQPSERKTVDQEVLRRVLQLKGVSPEVLEESFSIATRVSVTPSRSLIRFKEDE